MTTHIDRRKALAVVAAVPAAAALSALVVSVANDEKLLGLIQRYRSHMEGLRRECSLREMGDEELDRWMDKGCEILDEVVDLPVTTQAGALAALVLALEDEDSAYLVPDWHEEALLNMVRDYLEGRVA
jgi:hypothetical protein